MPVCPGQADRTAGAQGGEGLGGFQDQGEEDGEKEDTANGYEACKGVEAKDTLEKKEHEQVGRITKPQENTVPGF